MHKCDFLFSCFVFFFFYFSGIFLNTVFFENIFIDFSQWEAIFSEFYRLYCYKPRNSLEIWITFSVDNIDFELHLIRNWKFSVFSMLKNRPKGNYLTWNFSPENHSHPNFPWFPNIPQCVIGLNYVRWKSSLYNNVSIVKLAKYLSSGEQYIWNYFKYLDLIEMPLCANGKVLFHSAFENWCIQKIIWIFDMQWFNTS